MGTTVNITVTGDNNNIVGSGSISISSDVETVKILLRIIEEKDRQISALIEALKKDVTSENTTLRK